MTPTVGKKLSLLAGLLAALTAWTMGYIAYSLMERHFATSLRRDTLDTASLLASRLRNELRHAAEKGRLLAASALEEFKSPEDQIRFLESNLASDEQMIAMTLLRRSKASDGRFVPVFRLVKPEGDPAFLTERDFHDLDLKYPVDISSTGKGSVEVVVARLKDGTPTLRLSVPLVRTKTQGFTQLLVIELRQERLTAAFAEATAHFSFLLDRSGRVLVQTDPTHFTFGEDLSHLPILKAAQATEAPNGNLDYREIQGGLLQYASFQKVGYGSLMVVSQASRLLIVDVLKQYTHQAAAAAAFCVLMACALMLLGSWGVVGARLRRILSAMARIEGGRFNVSVPEKLSEDEIGTFAHSLQAMCDRLQERAPAQATFAKLNTRRVKSRLTEGKLNLSGERQSAWIVVCRLHGLDTAATQGNATDFFRCLNTFTLAASKIVEHNQGIVDRMTGGTFVSFWGVPVSDKQDADHALTSAIELRSAARTFNEELKRCGFHEIRLSVGVHFGPVAAGQVGSAERMEYTVVGEAVELATRLTEFTEQFGTDILTTGTAVQAAPAWFKTEKASSADGDVPELHELIGKSSQAGLPQDATEAEAA